MRKPKPDSVPKLISAESWAFVCCQCHRHLGRFPKFMYEIGKGDECQYCGCTSYTLKEGRVYGQKSKDWDWIEKTFLETWHLCDPEAVEWLKTEPPLETLLDFETHA